MCGIAGFADWRAKLSTTDAEGVLRRMTDAIVRRGPDDSGQWYDAVAGMGLGHRRLSIIDLSAAGHQPMISASGRMVIAFNGEIYNHLDLRARLPVQAWRGHSDTETLVAYCEHFGPARALADAVGMFALALWDRQERVLWLARDRFGEKPLYYGWHGDQFLFGSELSTLHVHDAFDGSVDLAALEGYLRHGYVPGPRSIYRQVAKLQPGHYLRLRHGQREPEVASYWSATQQMLAGRQHPFEGDDAAALEALEVVLGQAIRGQMVADVPLGAFLSGGVDSSLVVALMQAQASQPVRTFTIGFSEAGFDEAVHARAVAQHLGTRHTELYVSAADSLALIPSLPDLYDEPFADSSQMPTAIVSKLARSQVTVSLSGDGGDELFGGYSRYFWARNIWNGLRRAPRPLRRLAKSAIHATPVGAWNAGAALVRPLLPAHLRFPNAGDKLHKLAEFLDARDADQVYLSVISQWHSPRSVMRTPADAPTILDRLGGEAAQLGFDERMMLLDTLTYLPDDILTKVDRASMSVSLESRVPLLDHRVAEFAWRLPPHMKIRGGKGKWLLRQLLYRHVPQALIERPKTGFAVPIGIWLRGPLREWAESLLDPARLAGQGYFNATLVRTRWDEHQSGRRNWAYQLWTVLMFQAWLDRWQRKPRA